MLTTLRISGFAIVDQLEVRFGPGLNVLTGETGAGKSILLDALHLVLGGRLRAGVLREGAEEAVVEALFELPDGHPVAARLAALGLPVETGATELLVRRSASRSGRGRASVNGALCTVAMLEGALRGLVDRTGQHEHVSLLEEAGHLAVLDAFSGADAPGGVLDRYRAVFGALSAAVRERDALVTAREERARRVDYLAFQLRELEAAAPRPGEDLELERERQVLASAERLRDGARTAEALVYGEEGSAAERIARAARALTDAAAIDRRLEETAALLRSAQVEVEEAGRALASYAEEVGGDPERLAQVDERLAALRGLARKHGGTLDAALARAEEMRRELSAVEGDEARLSALELRIADLGGQAVARARELTRVRREAARDFAREVGAELQALAMGRCRVEVELHAPEDALVHAGAPLGADGGERARILLAPNPGEPARPLARIASGGELSRMLLATKRSLARTDPVDTYVFDEVDAGIGGGVAETVGRKLAEVARCRQVVCVTHLPQVAAFADRHLKVEKRVRGGRTTAAVAALATSAERRAEVARMLAGLTLTGSALRHAGALIAGARAATPGRPARGRREAPARTAARAAGS